MNRNKGAIESIESNFEDVATEDCFSDNDAGALNFIKN